jgi:hypothetical protein
MFIAGLIAGTVVAGGVGVVSAVTNNDAPIVACADKKTGAMRYSAKGKCKKSERKLSLQAPSSLAATQVAGPKGDAGSTGAQGPSGAAGPAGPSGTGFNTVPVSFGSKTLIQTRATGCCDFGNNNLFIVAEYENRTQNAINLGINGNTYQLWLDYFDRNGTLLPCGECAFQPELIDTASEPHPSCPVGQGQSFMYRLHLQGIHANKPVDAAYFSIMFRLVVTTLGTASPDHTLPLVRFAATPVESITPAAVISASNEVVSAAC